MRPENVFRFVILRMVLKITLITYTRHLVLIYRALVRQGRSVVEIILLHAVIILAGIVRDYLVQGFAHVHGVLGFLLHSEES